MIHKPYQRSERVAILVHRQLATIMQQRTDVLIWQKVTITGVELSKDLEHAKVFVSSLDEQNIEIYLKELNQTTKLLRQLLAKTLNLRVTPELHFLFDKTLIEGPRLAALIDKAIEEDEKNN